MNTPADVNALIEYTEATALDWNALVVPIPNKMLAMAQGTKEFKIGNGVDSFANLPLAFQLTEQGTIDTKAGYFPELQPEDADKIVVVNDDGSAFEVSDLTLADLITHSDLAAQLSAYSADNHDHDGDYLRKPDVDQMIDDGMKDATSSLENQDTISYLCMEKAQRDGVAIDLPTGFADEFEDESKIDLVSTMNMLQGDGAVNQSHWTRKEVSETYNISHAAGIGLDGMVYIFGGHGVDDASNIVFKYDYKTGEFTELAPMPQRLYQHGAVLIGRKVYVFGGKSNNAGVTEYSKALYVYDVDTNIWTQLSDMITARSQFAYGVINNKIYAACGRGVNGVKLALLESYDIETDTWTALANYPNSTRYYIDGIGYKGKFYVFGGYTGGGKNQIYEYDPLGNAWTELPAAPTLMRNVRPVIIEESICLFGGYDDTQYIPYVYRYTPNTQVWDIAYENPSPSYITAVKVDDVVIILNAGITYALDTNPETLKFQSVTEQADDNVVQAHILARINDSHITNKDTVFEATRDGGANWAPMMMEKNVLSTDDITILEGLTDFDKQIEPVTEDPAGVAIESHRGSVTQLTVDTADTSGRVDNGISDDFIGAKIVTEDGSVYIKDVSGNGTLVNSIQFEGTLSAGAHVVTDIIKQEVVDGEIVPTAALLEEWADDNMMVHGSNMTVIVGDELYIIGDALADPWGGDVYAYNFLTQSWRRCQDIPSYHAQEFTTIGTKIYALAGRDENGTERNSLYEYDTVTDTWTIKASVNTGRRGHGFAAVNGKLYCYAGFSGSAYLNDMWEYDPSTNQWTQRSNGPGLRYKHGMVGLNGKIYMYGGNHEGSIKNDFWVFDPIANNWTQLASTVLSKYSLVLQAIDGKIYQLGGHTGSERTAEANVYDPETDVWTVKSSAPNLFTTSTSSVYGSKIYIKKYLEVEDLGNVSVFGMLSYDTVTDTWDKYFEMPVARENAASCTYGKDIYLSGGKDDSRFNSFYRFNGVEQKWERLASHPIAISHHMITACDGKVYSYGGVVDAGYYDGFFVYDIETDKWTELPKLGIDRCKGHFATVGDKLYLFGGQGSSDDHKDMYEYDTVAGTWEQKADCPSAETRRYGTMVNIADKLYIFGGYDSAINAMGNLWVYDPSNNTWLQKADAPLLKASHTAVVYGTDMYVCCGRTGANMSTDIMKYDSLNNTWEQLAGAASIARTLHTAGIVNGTIYLFGGNDGSGNSTYKGELFKIKEFARGYNTDIIPIGKTNVIDIVPSIEGIYKTFCSVKTPTSAFQIYSDGEWEDIVRFENDAWEYRTAIGNWAPSSVNSAEAALSKAVVSSNNQMTVEDLMKVYLYGMDIESIALSNNVEFDISIINAFTTRQVTDATLPEGRDIAYRISGPYDEIKPVVHGLRFNWK